MLTITITVDLRFLREIGQSVMAMLYHLGALFAEHRSVYRIESYQAQHCCRCLQLLETENYGMNTAMVVMFGIATICGGEQQNHGS